MKTRCSWVDLNNDLYVSYHDKEWGVPVHDERKLFEFLILEGAQAGLSWLTVLKKREAYRQAFAGFDPIKVARFSEKDINALLQNEGIIRNRLKINAAVINAQKFLEVQKEFGSFNKYQWQFVNNKTIQNNWKDIKDLPALSEIAKSLSNDLKKRGFKFVGPTIIYAHMQAVGMVNDHTTDCFRYDEVRKLSKASS